MLVVLIACCFMFTVGLMFTVVNVCPIVKSVYGLSVPINSACQSLSEGTYP